MQFAMSNAVSETGGIKCLVHSESGIGKTMLVATCPEPILISAESGTLSLRKKNIERVHGVGTPGITYDVPMIIVRNIKDLNDAYGWVASSAEARAFRTVCLDSLTEIAEVVLSTAKKGAKDPRQAYGSLIDEMQVLVRSFRDLPERHVYMAAKQEPFKDELTGVVKYMPAMPGAKLGPQLPYFFDEVFRLGVATNKDGTTYRFLQTQPDMQYVAKDRSGSLAPVIYPHLGAAFTTMLGD